MWVAIHQSNERYGSDRSFDAILQAVRRRHGEGTIVGPPGGETCADGRIKCALPKVYRGMFTVRGFAASLLGVAATGWLLARRRLRGDKLLLVNTLALSPVPILGACLGYRVVTFVREILDDQQLGATAILALAAWPSSLVICNSRATRDWVASRIGHGGKLRVVHNGIEVPNPDASDRRASAVSTGENLVYVGRLSSNKGVDVLIAALSRVIEAVPGARLVLVGGASPGGDAYVASLKALVQELHMESRVEFAGFQADAAPYFERSDVAVVPSRFSEPFGRTAVEAMLAGTPVVAAAVGGLPEIIEDGESGMLFPRGDHVALAEKLVAVLTDPALRHRLGTAGQRRARAHFTESHMQRRFTSLLQKVMR